jgi:hypothetical protein
MNYYTHINRNVIDSNRKNGTNNPHISVRKGKRGKAEYASEVILHEGSRIIYSHEGTLLPCGARLVIISKEKPEIV